MNIIDIKEGVALAVQNKAGEWFSPTGYVQITDNGFFEACLDHASTMQVLGDQELFEAASNSLMRAAVGIVNLTQHAATPDQVAANVVEAPHGEHVKALLTFNEIPTHAELGKRAAKIAEYAYSSGCRAALIGGAPFFMSTLERALIEQGITPLYAFSKRESVETVKEDGTVVKTNVFKHGGFVKVD